MAIVSDILQATPAPADGSPTPTRTWQWLRDGAAITSATSSAYTTVDADANKAITVRQTETNFMGTASATSIAFATIDPFQVLTALFSLSEPGVWLDPSDTSTMFQDVTGATPVTATGQTVGLVLDKSKGLALGPELVTNGDLATDSGWAKNGTPPPVISGGVASWSGTSNSFSLVQNMGLQTGKTYKVTFTVVTATSGLISVKINGGGALSQSPNVASPGTYTYYLSSTAADGNLAFVVASSFIGSIDNISVKELAGNHLTQATAASRPIYGIEPAGGRRNLLTFTEQFDNAAWPKTSVTATANTQTAPDGTLTADTLTASAGTSARSTYQSGGGFGSALTMTVYAKAGTIEFMQLFHGSSATIFANFNLNTGVLGTVGAGATATITSVGNGWYRCSITFTPATASLSRIAMISSATAAYNQSWTAVGTETIFLWGAQLETGPTATAYQRVTDQWNVTEAGKASVSYLAFDGTDDFLVSPTITPGIDKAQVFAGVRKLSDAAGGVIAEMSAAATNNGIVSLASSVLNVTFQTWFSLSRGTASSQNVPTGYPAPLTSILTNIGDISADTSLLRVNGTQAATSATDQGTGNYLAYPLYVGRRGGTTLPFNGRIYQMIVRFGTNLSAERIARTEQLINEKTGAY